MLSFGLQNINCTFFLPLERLNMVDGTLLFVCFLLTLLFLPIFAVKVLIASTRPIFSHFNIEKHHPHFDFIFLTTAHFFYCIFSGSSTLNTYTLPCFFVDRVQKFYCYIPGRTFTSKNS